MLRNELPSQRALWVGPPLLGGGVLIASGLGRELEPVVWVGAAALTCGLAVVLAEVLTLVVRAAPGRVLIASRIGVALSCAHVVVALCLGALIFSYDRPFGGVAYGRWLLIHLHVALLGWIALLILPSAGTSARCLPRPPPRRSEHGRSTNSRSSPVSGCFWRASGRTRAR
jgi:hypothetical protein